jgi:hypothetical protein
MFYKFSLQSVCRWNVHTLYNVSYVKVKKAIVLLPPNIAYGLSGKITKYFSFWIYLLGWYFFLENIALIIILFVCIYLNTIL